MYRSLSKAVASYGLGAALLFLLIPRLSDRLETQTSIVGYPVFFDFNINKYFWIFYLLAIVLPVFTFSFYCLMSRSPKSAKPLSRLKPVSRTPLTLDRKLPPYLYTWIIGLTLGFGFVRPGSILVASILYLIIVSVGFRKYMSWVNIFAAPLGVVSLYFVSASTGVQVQGTTTFLPWFPAWVAVLTVGGLWSYAGYAFFKKRAPKDIERSFIFLVSLPLLLFVLNATLPGLLRGLDAYHEGETLGSAALLMKGLFPWRDVLFIHGLLNDPGRSLFGFKLFGDTRWASWAGESLVLAPLYWVIHYYFCYFIFRRNRLWVFCVGWLVPISCAQLPVWAGFWNLIGMAWIRFILIPPVLVLFYRLLEKPSVLRSGFFTLLLFIQALITPETSFLPIALGVTLAAYETYHAKVNTSFWSRYSRCLAYIVWGATLSGVVCLYLMIHKAWIPFLQYFEAAQDHRFSGGIKAGFQISGYWVMALLPVVLFQVGVWGPALFFRNKLVLQKKDWVWIGMVLFLLMYYQKFVSRADDHVLMPFTLSLPVLYYLFYRGLNLLPRVATYSLFVILIYVKAPYVRTAFESTETRFSPTFEKIGGEGKLKFSNLSFSENQDLIDLRRFFAENLKSGKPSDRTIFDFTNQPALFFYLLDLTPATRYFYVSMALLDKTQQRLIDSLESTQPRYVAFYKDSMAMHWDGIPNMVRHPDISYYLLTHYHPADYVGHTLLLERNPATLADSIPQESLYEKTETCDWGFVPHHQSKRLLGLPEKEALSCAFTTRKESKYITQINLPDKRLEDFKFLEIQFKEMKSAGQVILSDSLTRLRGADLISFMSHDEGSTTYKIQVGSCIQWHRMKGRTLYLMSQADPHLTQVRLTN